MLLLLADRGFNLLDEAFYVQWIATPERYAFSIQPFGLFFHPFYDLLQQSIIALRILGVVLLALSGAILGWSLARYCRMRLELEASPTSFAALGASFQLTYYVLWIPTPSYNLLANVSSALVLAGCLGWRAGDPARRSRRMDAVFSALVGFGGCWAFYGKPTFAALAALAVAMVLLIDIVREHWRVSAERAAIAILSSVVPLYLHVTYVMPIPTFIATIQGGLAALNYGNSLSDLPLKTLQEFKAAPRLLLLTGLATVVVAAWRLSQPQARSRPMEAATAVLLAAATYQMARAVMSVAYGTRLYWDAFGPELETMVLAQISAGLAWRPKRLVDSRAVALLLVLAALPFAVAFGTANPLIRQISISMTGALFASTVAGLLFLREGKAKLLQCTLAVGALALLVGAVLKPYRIPKTLLRQSSPLVVPHFNGTLRVDPETKKFAMDMVRIRRQARLGPDVPVLDLSGGGPGTALFLGGRPPGNPWLIQFFNNAVPMADAFWRTLDSGQKARAWIVGPIHPSFAGSAVARQITAGQARYICVGHSSMSYWQRPMTITIWAPREQVPSPSGCPVPALGMADPQQLAR